MHKSIYSAILDEPGPYDKPKRKSTFNPELANALNPNKAELVEQQVGKAKDGLKKVNSPETKKELGFLLEFGKTNWSFQRKSYFKTTVKFSKMQIKSQSKKLESSGASFAMPVLRKTNRKLN